MLFDYHTFINELRSNEDKKEIIEKYEKLVGPLGQKPLYDERWYRLLVNPFHNVMDYEVPCELKHDFDWNLLARLAASSLSSQAEYIIYDNQVELQITVQSGDNEVQKRISELWGFQILRLYEIFAEENINLCSLCYEDKKEKTAIYDFKRFILNRWKAGMEMVGEGV